MTLAKNRYLSFLSVLFLLFFCPFNNSYGQNDNIPVNIFGSFTSFRQDTARETRKRNLLGAQEPDTNFTFEKYAAFLRSVSDTSKYIVLPLDEFKHTENKKKIIIGLRHDLDNDLNHAFQFSDTEFKLGFRSTYYLLHTAPYYLENPNNMAVHSQKILPVLKTMQNERHFEIGLHNDLVTLQAVYNIDPVQFLHNELSWLRSNGIKITGSASHGSPYCYTYKYLNFYFFEECTFPVVGQFVNNLTLPLSGINVPMKKGKLSDFGLHYEAYFLNNNKYFSDATVTAGVRWNIGMLDPRSLQAGDRVIILLHPIHWHKASVNAEIESFHVAGEEYSSVDPIKKTVSVRMPYGTDRSSLKAGYVISPGAQAKVAGKLQTSGITPNDLTSPKEYRIFAENREVRKDWTINVFNAKNNTCYFESFSVPGFAGAVSIDSLKRTIHAEVSENADLSMIKVDFVLSHGARAYINGTEQSANRDYLDFLRPVVFEIIAEDGVTASEWVVIIVHSSVGVEDAESDKSGMSVYPNPTNGIITMNFQDITVSPVAIEIFNSMGKKIYTEIVNKTGSFSVSANLSGYPAGVYFIKYTGSANPVKILIRKN